VSITKKIQKFSGSTFVHSVAKVVGGNFVISIISLVTSVFVARWATPYELGLWNLVLLVTIYTPTLQLGVFNGLNRQLPFFIGKGDQETALKMGSGAYAWCLVLAMASAVATVLFAIFFWWSSQAMLAYTSIAIGIIVVCLWPTQYLTVTYRTSAEFGRLAGRNMVVALISVPLTMLVLWFGYIGLMARAVLIAVLNVLSLYIRRPIVASPKWNKEVLLNLGRVGMPIWVLGQLGVCFMTLDRIVLADSPLLLGYFSISIQATTFAGMIPIAITMVLYPQMVQRYGETNNAMAAWKIVKNGALLATALGIFAGICGWVLIPFFIKYLLPAYVPGTEAAQWACLGGVALGFSVYNNVFNVIQRQDLYLVALGIGLLVFVGTWILLTQHFAFDKLVSAVQSMLAANLVMSCSSAYITRWACLRHDRKHFLAATA
jgi:O-antigen/teichoic acid export membrane protein